MKTFVIENNLIADASDNAPDNANNDANWYFLDDSAICNAGKPFFIPELEDFADARLVIALKVNRLGKSISPRFAKRYYSEAAPAIHFRLPALREELIRRNLSTDRAYSFDRSLIIGDFMPVENFTDDSAINLLKNGESAASWSVEKLRMPIDEIVAAVSVTNSLKMGDIIIPSLSESVEVRIGDMLEIKSGETSLLSVPVK